MACCTYLTRIRGPATSIKSRHESDHKKPSEKFSWQQVELNFYSELFEAHNNSVGMQRGRKKEPLHPIVDFEGTNYTNVARFSSFSFSIRWSTLSSASKSFFCSSFGPSSLLLFSNAGAFDCPDFPLFSLFSTRLKRVILHAVFRHFSVIRSCQRDCIDTDESFSSQAP